MMRITRLKDVEPTPWLNGAGSTRNMWLGPSVSHWQWRISVASVDSDSRFSTYPGVTRHFAVLQGNGVRLRLPDGEREVTIDSEPLQFEGGAAPQCTLIDGPTLDLNLLVRDGAGSGSLERVEAGKPWRSSARRRAVWCGSAAQVQIEGLPPCNVPANSLACIDHASGKAWMLGTAGQTANAWWIAIESPTH